MTLRLRYAVRSHVGNVREGNEDSAFAGSRLAVVADGMGGHAAGEVASSAAISALAHLDEDEVSVDLLDALAMAVQEANDQLRDMVTADPALDGMGTTLTVLLASGSRLGVAHVGDSRAYLLREGELTLVTHDQTLVQRMVDEGQITLEQAERHPRRALLTQALDGREGVEPDLSLRELRRGDRYLLCSDGLSGVVHEETLAETLTLPDLDTAAERLIELALKGGGPDNVTVVVADVVEDIAGLSDTPMVAGAAAEKDSVPGAARLAINSTGGHLASAAEKARRLLPGRRRGATGGAAAGAGSAGTGGGPEALHHAGTGAPGTETAEPDSDITGYHRIPGLSAPPTAPAGGDTAPLDTAPLDTAAFDGTNSSSGPATGVAPPGAPIADTPPAGMPPIPPDEDQPGRSPTLIGGPVPDDADGAGDHRRSRRGGGDPRGRNRRRLVIALAVAILVLLLGGLWAFSRTQWYVAESDGRVALYQGVKSKPLGVPLSAVERTYFSLTCLQPVDQGRIRSGYIADDRADAERFVETLQTLPSSAATGPRVPPDPRTNNRPAPNAVPAPSQPPAGVITAAECTTAGGS